MEAKLFYIFEDKIYDDPCDLDEVLFEYFAQDTKCVGSVENQVESAYSDGTVDKESLSFDQFIKMLKDGYKFI